jgi:sporulation protein YlmC with PRC-barrel domain
MTHCDLARDILDTQILDVEGTACGRVDDLELKIDSKGRLHVNALLIGPGALSARLPALLECIVQMCFSRSRVRVPWSDVKRAHGEVHLRRRAAELGLGRTNRKLGRWISRS